MEPVDLNDLDPNGAKKEISAKKGDSIYYNANDAFGLIGILFGVTTIIFVVLSCLTMGYTLLGVAPSSAIGTICGAVSRGRNRQAALILNIPFFILSLAFWVFAWVNGEGG